MDSMVDRAGCRLPSLLMESRAACESVAISRVAESSVWRAMLMACSSASWTVACVPRELPYLRVSWAFLDVLNTPDAIVPSCPVPSVKAILSPWARNSPRAAAQSARDLDSRLLGRRSRRLVLGPMRCLLYPRRRSLFRGLGRCRPRQSAEVGL